MPTYTPATKNTTTHTPEVEAGGAWTYNQADVTYNRVGMTYNALKPATAWTPETEH